MKVVKEDQTNLIALVALLVSTAGFKEELSSLRLGTTSFTMFDVFLIATVAFGCLLYFHLLINSYVLFLKALRTKKKMLYLIILRALALLVLIIIPISSVYIASSNWLTTEVCKEGVFIDELLIESEPKNRIVCQTPLLSTILPLTASILIPGIVFWFVNRREQEFNRLSPEQKNIMMSIQEYRIIQAVSSDIAQINNIQLKIDELEKQYQSLSKTKLKKRQ